MEFDIYFNKTVEENAAIYYEKAKKAKRKIAGAETAIKKFQEMHTKEIQKGSDAELEMQNKKEITKRKTVWFEKFRWFFTSSGILVIGGRDATTNEMVIKKYVEANDIVFHTDQAGSPFFVPKPILDHGQKTTEVDILEIGDATCSFSRAWKNGLTTTSVFYVKSDQVTKEANTGEYLTKGAFVIRGKVNYVDNKIDLAVGIIKSGEYHGIIMCAPSKSVEKHCEQAIKIGQGEEKPSDIAKILKKMLNVDVNLDEIIRVLPPGNMKIIKERARSEH